MSKLWLFILSKYVTFFFFIYFILSCLTIIFKDVKTNIDKSELSFDDIKRRLERNSIDLVDGGKWFRRRNNAHQTVSANCTPPTPRYNKLAFIIPYRDRLRNLKIFLNNMHPFLVRHGIDYGVYLIEPAQNLSFNRGILMNIGFIEAINDSVGLTDDGTRRNDSTSTSKPYWDCFVFHDVDMLPEQECLHYTCDPEYPIHYAVAVSKFRYR